PPHESRNVRYAHDTVHSCHRRKRRSRVHAALWPTPPPPPWYGTLRPAPRTDRSMCSAPRQLISPAISPLTLPALSPAPPASSSEVSIAQPMQVRDRPLLSSEDGKQRRCQRLKRYLTLCPQPPSEQPSSQPRS